MADDRIQALTKLLAEGYAAAEGAQVTLDAWADEIGCDPANNSNYCRLLDWMRDAKATLTEETTDARRPDMPRPERDAR